LAQVAVPRAGPPAARRPPAKTLRQMVHWRRLARRTEGRGTCAASALRGLALGCVLLRQGACDSEPGCSQEVLSRWALSGYPRELDIGIYWYGSGDEFEKATGAGPSRFYDPKRRTLVYFHGWTGGNGGWTVKCGRITSRCEAKLCPNQDLLIEEWLADGWNVGFFYWDQIGDEDCARDAEQKVWFDQNRKGLRWKSYDPSVGESDFHEFLPNTDSQGVSVFSVADLCVQSISAAMGDFGGSNVRFVGHSLGSQLAIRCADKLHARGHPAAPNRVALLEPFFTQLHGAGVFRCSAIEIHKSVGEYIPVATAEIVRNLWETKGVATEVYKSSVLTEIALTPLVGLGNPNHPLEAASTLVTYYPAWCGGLGPINAEFLGRFGHLECKHCAAFPLYFLQFGRPAPALTKDSVHLGSGSVFTSCPTPASSCKDQEIVELVERQLILNGLQRWEQVTGMSTFDVGDDTFRLLPDQDVDLSSEEAALKEHDAELASEHWHLRLWRSAVRSAMGLTTALALLCAGRLVWNSLRDRRSSYREYLDVAVGGGSDGALTSSPQE